MLRETEQDLETYKEFPKYYPEMHEKYLKCQENGTKFTLKLLVGDRSILFEIPEGIASLPKDLYEKYDKISNKVQNTRKRSIDNVIHNVVQERVLMTVDSNIVEVETCEDGNHPKKRKLDLGDMNKVQTKFHEFGDKVASGCASRIDIVGEDPTFVFVCPNCDGSVKIGYKVTKNGQPSFVSTNW